MMLEYYNRKGQLLTFEQWISQLPNLRKRVAVDKIPGGRVSTIFLFGMNYNTVPDRQLILFETMIFMRDESHPMHLYREQYTTEALARWAHRNIRKEARRIQQMQNGPKPLKVRMRRR